MAVSPDFLRGYDAGIEPDRLEFFCQAIQNPIDLPFEDDPSGVTRVYSEVFEQGGNDFGLGALARAEYEKSEDPAQYNLNTEQPMTIEQFAAEGIEADIALGLWMRDRGIAGWRTMLPENLTQNNQVTWEAESRLNHERSQNGKI